MKQEIAELEKMQTRISEIKKLAEKNAAAREVDGCYDDELLAECMSVLEYATYHDGRYGQDQNWEKFQSPAQKLVMRLAKRLGRKAYDGFGGTTPNSPAPKASAWNDLLGVSEKGIDDGKPSNPDALRDDRQGTDRNS